MKLKIKIYVRLLWQVLPVVMAHGNVLGNGKKAESLGKSKNAVEIILPAEYSVGPPESLNDQFYLRKNDDNGTRYSGNVARGSDGFVSTLKSQRDLKNEESEREETRWTFRENQEYHPGFTRKTKHSHETLNQLKRERDFEEIVSCNNMYSLLDKSESIGSEQIKKLSVPSETLNENLREFNNGLSATCLKTLNRLLKIQNGKLIGSRKVWRGGKGTKSTSAHTDFKPMNNITRSNRYRIGNIFIFNQLSDIQDGVLDKLASRGGDGESGKSCEGCQSPRPGNFSKSFPLEGGNDFQTGNNSVTSEQISQMSKIIDFVQRYHGTMNNLDAAAEGLQFRRGIIDGEKRSDDDGETSGGRYRSKRVPLSKRDLRNKRLGRMDIRDKEKKKLFGGFRKFFMRSRTKLH